MKMIWTANYKFLNEEIIGQLEKRSKQLLIRAIYEAIENKPWNNFGASTGLCELSTMKINWEQAKTSTEVENE